MGPKSLPKRPKKRTPQKEALKKPRGKDQGLKRAHPPTKKTPGSSRKGQRGTEGGKKGPNEKEKGEIKRHQVGKKGTLTPKKVNLKR